MAVLLKLLCVYVCCWQCLHLASGAFLDFRLVEALDQNNLLLECYNSQTGTIDSGATIDFFAPGSSVPHRSLSTGQGNAGLPHTVTPANEALLRCTTRDGSEVSDPMVAIAAVPSSYSDVPQKNNAVFNGNTGELTCPIELGNLHIVLDPYDISWKQISEGGLSEAVTNQNLLSNDNTVLSVPITNSTASNAYQCELQLRRCDIVDPVSGSKCQSLRYTGPLMGFNVFEPIRVVSRPMHQDVSFGGTASFNCVGYGSFLDITWRFDFPSGDSFSCRDSCNHSALSYSESTSNLTINATLEIDTSQLLDGVYTILCVLQETVPAELSLEEGIDQLFPATLASPSVLQATTPDTYIHTTEAMNTTDTTDPTVSTSSTSSIAATVSAAVAISILVGLVISIGVCIAVANKNIKTNHFPHFVVTSSSLNSHGVNDAPKLPDATDPSVMTQNTAYATAPAVTQHTTLYTTAPAVTQNTAYTTAPDVMLYRS